MHLISQDWLTAVSRSVKFYHRDGRASCAQALHYGDSVYNGRRSHIEACSASRFKGMIDPMHQGQSFSITSGGNLIGTASNSTKKSLRRGPFSQIRANHILRPADSLVAVPSIAQTVCAIHSAP